MKKTALIIVMGVLLGATAYCCLLWRGTAQHQKLENSPEPELLWFKMEFSLNDAEFEKFKELHYGYLPECEAMCERIDSKNAELRSILTREGEIGVDSERLLHEANSLMLQCQKQMFEHFYEVARILPEHQRQHYLQWVVQKTLTPSHHAAHATDRGGHDHAE